MIDKGQAQNIAEKKIEQMSSNGHDFVLMNDKTVERPFGWVFFYATKKYLRTHDPQDLVPGATPIVVLRENGATDFLPSSIPPARAIDIYQRHWEEKKSSSKHE